MVFVMSSENIEIIPTSATSGVIYPSNHISSSMTFNAQFPGKDKKMEYLNVHAIPTRYKNENAVQIAIANITELKAEEIEALNLQRNLLT